MSHIEFNDSLRVGNKMMDQEHEELISYINLLDKAVENEASGYIINHVAHSLVEYSLTHFFVEEEMMKAYNYPDSAAHLKAHDGFRIKVAELLKSVEMGEEIDIKWVLVFLTEWLSAHILKVDAKLADFLKDKTLS